jgi:hypothetical protein
VANAIIARHGKGINSTVEPGHIVMGALVAGLANRTGTTQDELYVGFGDRVANVVRPEANSDGMRTVDGVARRVDDRGELEDTRRIGNFELYDFPKEAISPTLNALRAKDSFIYGGDSDLRDDEANPIGFDTNRFRCIGNGVVAPVAEFIGRRLVAVDAKYWKEANG